MDLLRGQVRRGRAIGVWCVCALALAGLGGGCSSRAQINPGLQVTPYQMDRAKERAKRVIRAGADPNRIINSLMKDVNVSISANVVVTKAAACWPQDELAYEIALKGDDSDQGLQRAADEAMKKLERQMRFIVNVQLPLGRDPSEISFALSTGQRNVEYPPVSVAQPVHLRDYMSALDPNTPPSSLWSYDVWFPIAGSPGYPPIGVGTQSLCLLVKDGDATAEAWFRIPQASLR